MSNAASFYTIQSGDTLGKVADRFGTSVTELCKINGIKNANKIAVGQRIALKAEAVCKVGVQLLDRDRNPMPNAKVRLEYCGKLKELSSGQNGRLPDILTDTPEDIVKIFIARADGSWKQITEVVSDWGNKLVTLVSPKIKIEADTKPHPKDDAGQPKRDRANPGRKPAVMPVPPQTSTAQGKPQSTYGDGKGTKAKEETTKDGLPVTKLTNDQAELDFLKDYIGGTLLDSDYETAAKEFDCEANVIKAVAKVESGGKSGFDKKNRPVILYERHVFSRNSGRKYDQSNPDLSSKIGYKLKKKGTKVSEEGLKTNYYAGSSDENYMRLAKAYALDKDAALKACSWGKFQVLAENFKDCGYSSVTAFVVDQVKNEAGQLRAFVGYIKSRKLQKHLKDKNWAKIAEGYNGKGYKKFNYDERIKSAYEALSK